MKEVEDRKQLSSSKFQASGVSSNVIMYVLYTRTMYKERRSTTATSFPHHRRHS